LLELRAGREGLVRIWADPAQHWSVREEVGVVLQGGRTDASAHRFWRYCFSPRNYGRSEDEVKTLVKK
jgi:hypothetical protein